MHFTAKKHSDDTKNKMRGKRVKLRKLNDQQISQLKQLKINGYKMRELADKFKVSINTIYSILHNKGSYKID